MSGIKGFFLLFMVFGAMYLGAQAEAEAEAEADNHGRKGESAELRGHVHFGNTNCFMCSWNHVQYTLELTVSSIP